MSYFQDKYKNLTDAEWARAADGLLVKLQTLMITCQLSFAYLPQTFNQTSMHLFKPKTDWICYTDSSGSRPGRTGQPPGAA